MDHHDRPVRLRDAFLEEYHERDPGGPADPPPQHDVEDGFMWREVRLTELTPQTYLALGEGLAYLSWVPVEE